MPNGKSYPTPLQEIIESLTVYSGTTTADGAVGGTTLIDSNLIGLNDFITDQVTVLIMDGACWREKKGATAFAPLTGTITFPAFSAQIVVGVNYKLLNTAAMTIIAAVLASLGEMDDAATSDDLSDIATTSAQAKLRRLLLRFSANAFSATINGAAQTDVEGMLGALATYLKAAGAAFSSTVGGAGRTDVEAALTALAAYFNAASAALSVTIDNGGAARSNLNDILSDLGAMLGGAAGITTWRNGVAPGDGVSFAEAIRYISDNVGLEGATALANKLTAARAALLDEITALRMGELDAANMPADIDTINTNQGDPSAHTLTSTTAKLGNLARAVAVILGTRWDAAGDLGTDIAELLKLITTADGAGNFPTSVVDQSILSKLLSKVAGGDTSSYDETTDSMEMLSDKLGAYSGDGGAAADDSVKAHLDLIKTQIDKLAGAAPGVGTTTANWNTATGTSGESGEDLVTIGANDTRYKLHSLVLSTHALTNGAVITVKLFMQVNGTERCVYRQTFNVDSATPGIPVIESSWAIHEALRIEVYSDTSESVGIDYDYMLEAM